MSLPWGYTVSSVSMDADCTGSVSSTIGSGVGWGVGDRVRPWSVLVLVGELEEGLPQDKYCQTGSF